MKPGWALFGVSFNYGQTCSRQVSTAFRCCIIDCTDSLMRISALTKLTNVNHVCRGIHIVVFPPEVMGVQLCLHHDFIHLIQ